MKLELYVPSFLTLPNNVKKDNTGHPVKGQQVVNERIRKRLYASKDILFITFISGWMNCRAFSNPEKQRTPLETRSVLDDEFYVRFTLTAN